jgi:hypothetical protein
MKPSGQPPMHAKKGIKVLQTQQQPHLTTKQNDIK